MRNKTLMRWLMAAAAIILAGACGTPKKVVYFQDLTPGESKIRIPETAVITVVPGDKLTIVVNTKDAELTNLFNLPYISRQLGSTTAVYNNSQGVSAYTVDSQGQIDFPVVGKVTVAGMSREEISRKIKEELVSQNLVKDPVVTVEFANLCISVIGEVAKPGRYDIDRDRMTILEALSMAGDLTINGRRENVMVIRDENDVRNVYSLDLTSASQIVNSPGYYIRQGDVVYVTPNDVKIRQSTVNGNNVRSTSFWISLASLLTSVAVMVINLLPRR